MKVLILANNDVGLYNFRKELIERLTDDKFEVYISLPNGKKVQKMIDMGCKFIETDIQRRGTSIKSDLKLMRFYKKIMKKIKPDVILTYTIKPNIYGGMAAAGMGIPYLANVTGLGTALENKGKLQTLTKNMYKAAFRKAECVFFQNEENRDFFIKNKLYNKKYQLIPGSGVNVDKFNVMEYPAEDTVEFVFISRVMKEKGVDQYIEAAEFIRGKYPNTRFHICGACEEEYKDELDALQRNNIIIYHGLVSDVREVLKDTHCTIHPTYYPEGMSNVLLESSACARPIITTNRSGCREIIDDGINGYIVRQKDSADLIEKIEKFLALPYEEKRLMGLNGRKKVEKEFDRQIVVNAYMEKINKIKEK